MKLTLLCAGALAAVLAAAPAMADPIVLKFSADTPGAGATWAQFMVPWAKKIEANSKGTLKIELYPDGLLSKTGDTLDRVGAGVADIGWENPGALGSRLATLGVVGVPGTYDDAGEASAALWRGYEKGIIGVEFKNEKVFPLLIYATPTLGLFMKGPLKDTGDIRGLKFALGSKLRAQQIEHQGGVAVALNPPDYYQGLQKGVVDGMFTALVAATATKTDELAHYYLRGPFGGGITIIAMSKAVYEKLPPEAKKAIDDNSKEAGSRAVGSFNEKYENEQWDRISKIPGNQVIRMNAADIAKWQATYDFAADIWTKDVPNGKTVVDTFKADVAAVKAGK